MIFKNRNEKKNNKGRDFLDTKIELICSKDELRPAMQCVYFKNGFLYATDALVAIKQSLHLHGINEEVVKHLDGKLLHSSHLKLMKNCDYFECVEGGIKSKKGIIEMIHLFTDERYPDVEAILPKSGFSEINNICINANVLKNLQDVMLMLIDDTYKFVKLNFRSRNQAIVITTNVPQSDQIGILMPVMGRD